MLKVNMMWSNKKKENRLPYDDVLLSKTIDWLRFPMVLLVIFVHSQGRNYVSSSPSIGLELSILEFYDYFATSCRYKWGAWLFRSSSSFQVSCSFIKRGNGM